MDYCLVLGLEIHLHVKTKSKMFCGCDANIFGVEANTHVCPTCLGLPGALPVPNFEAVQKTQLLGLALGCTLNKDSRFDRKHYFYPDLPKGYQISQYRQPLCEGGLVELESGKIVEVERIHLEEDVAKSFHEDDKTLIDFNKSGMPLIEIVTKPVIKTPEDAAEFCKKIQEVVRILNVSDADMEKGQMRLEVNISIRTKEAEVAGQLPKYKVEVKNINSFRFMEKAIKYEINRQSEILSSGKEPAQENRGWDEDLGRTVAQRDKEEAHDYRYFPDPDIPPMSFDDKYFEELKKSLVKLPWQLQNELIDKYKLSSNVAKILTSNDNQELLDKFEQLVSKGIDAIKVANLLINKKETRNLSLDEFTKLVSDANQTEIDATAINLVIKEVLSKNPEVVDAYKSGKLNSMEFLVGQVMKELKGKVNAEAIRESLKSSLN